MARHRLHLLLLLGLVLGIPGSLGEYVRVFRILEGVPAGTRIGYIGEAEVRSWRMLILVNNNIILLLSIKTMMM